MAIFDPNSGYEFSSKKISPDTSGPIFSENNGYEFSSKKLGPDSGLTGFELPSLPTSMVEAEVMIENAMTDALDTFNDFTNAEFSLPGIGDFSLASAADKAGELVDSAIATGKDALDSVTSFFTGDKSKAVDKIKEQISSPVNKLINENQATTETEYAGSNFVRLRSQLFSDDFVLFNVMPTIAESRTANYEEVNIVHHPGQILRYRTTSPRAWTITARLISRNSEEASNNLKSVNLLRSWLMPYYGEGTKATFADKLGAPPDVLIFSAYGDKTIPEHPVVLESFQTSFPNDIDYIPTLDKTPFPVILEVTLGLKESWSPKEFSQFDLSQFKSGDLRSAFAGKSDLRSLLDASGNKADSSSDSPPDLSALMAGSPQDTSEPIIVTPISGFEEILGS